MEDLVYIHGDRFTVKAAPVLENLCTNALKYGSEKANVTIVGHCLREGVLLSINNKGPVISKVMNC